MNEMHTIKVMVVHKTHYVVAYELKPINHAKTQEFRVTNPPVKVVRWSFLLPENIHL